MNLLLRSSLLAVSLRGVSGFVAPRVFTTFVARTMSSLNAKPFAVIVQAEIQPERVDEFVKLIEENAVNTRKEPGCLRFGTFRFFPEACVCVLMCST
jgi:menaquinone-dependent protoporphyrinogen IX oxidase